MFNRRLVTVVKAMAFLVSISGGTIARARLACRVCPRIPRWITLGWVNSRRHWPAVRISRVRPISWATRSARPATVRSEATAFRPTVMESRPARSPRATGRRARSTVMSTRDREGKRPSTTSRYSMPSRLFPAGIAAFTERGADFIRFQMLPDDRTSFPSTTPVRSCGQVRFPTLRLPQNCVKVPKTQSARSFVNQSRPDMVRSGWSSTPRTSFRPSSDKYCRK